jgi:toxin-antitoxin system PIN domain toxin
VTDLLDANVLIALTVSDHVHHGVVESWFASRQGGFATCPITQGALIRHLLRAGARAGDAREVLVSLTTTRGHEFWPDSVGYDEVSLRGVVGHRQVTDAYLAGLARARRGHLVTLDGGIVALHPDVATLLDP